MLIGKICSEYFIMSDISLLRSN